jgi:hypothetical protein
MRVATEGNEENKAKAKAFELLRFLPINLDLHFFVSFAAF